MILVDTSVLIDYLGGNDNEATGHLMYIMDSRIPWGINPFIYQELLQGVQTAREFKQLKQYLDTQSFYYWHDERKSFARAARIYFDCRRQGITIGSTIDCLIAQTAIENGLLLLHNDADFERMTKVIDLRFYPP